MKGDKYLSNFTRMINKGGGRSETWRRNNTDVNATKSDRRTTVTKQTEQTRRDISKSRD